MWQYLLILTLYGFNKGLLIWMIIQWERIFVENFFSVNQLMIDCESDLIILLLNWYHTVRHLHLIHVHILLTCICVVIWFVCICVFVSKRLLFIAFHYSMVSGSHLHLYFSCNEHIKCDFSTVFTTKNTTS